MGFIQKREIKFRDFDFDTKKVRHFNLDNYDKNEHDSYGNITEFTGTKDKNGKDIIKDKLDTNGNKIVKNKITTSLPKNKFMIYVLSEDYINYEVYEKLDKII